MSAKRQGTNYRRWLVCAGVMGLGVAAVGPYVIGDSRKPESKLRLGTSEGRVDTAAERRAKEEIEPSRFAGKPIITYKTVGGENLFAMQLQPSIEAAPRPRDILILIDTSASQAVGPLKASGELANALSKALTPNDRVSVWTANMQGKAVTKGFVEPSKVSEALSTLKDSYPSGATSLKASITSALETFEAGTGRQRTIVFLGDGLSVADPLDGEARNSLVAEMVRREVCFMPVPMGLRLDPINLHGLATGTGGRTVRIESGETTPQMVAKLDEALKAPVLYPESSSFGADLAEVLPGKLPPLRTDVPTLVVGKIKEGAKPTEVVYKITGRVAGKALEVGQTLPVPAADDANFFLTQVVGQWRERKDRPAILQGDRALAFAFEQNRLAMEDALSRGELALRNGRPDAAAKLFRQASQLDPASNEAKAGIKLSDDLTQGRVKAEELAVKMGIPGITLVAAQAKPEAKPGQAKDEAVDLAANDAVKEVQARRAAAEQQVQKRVNEGIKEAGRQLRESPTVALEDLKRLKDEVEGNIDIGLATRNSLVGRLVREIQKTERDGREIERQQKEFVEASAKLQAMADEEKRVSVQSERVRERLRFYHDLISQAREDEAQRVAQSIRRDLTNQGIEIPQAVTAAYYEGGRAYHLRELRDLRRVREENFLAVLLEVERSHIPFPDEPPIVWPGDNSPLFQRRAFDRSFRFRNWKELSAYRRDAYNDPGYEPPVPESAKKIREVLVSQISYAGQDLPSTKIKEELERLLTDRFNVDVIFNYKAFEADGNEKVEDQEIGDRKIRKFKGKLSNLLRIITEEHIKGGTGATYLIRDDHIEITTQTAALNEKVTRIYPVADLVFPVQNAINPAQVQQQATLFGFGGSYGLAGQSIMSMAGGMGMMGMNGMGMGGMNMGMGGGMMGMGGMGMGGMGMMGMGGGIAGLGGLGGMAGMAGMGGGGIAGGMGGMGGGAMGMGGGMQGMGGGMMGMGGMGGGNMQGFGQGGVSGSIGFQGGPDYQSLIYNIRYMIGTSKDWTYQPPMPGVMPTDPTGSMFSQTNPGSPDGTFSENGGTLGPYPPTFALIVRNTSRTHTGRFTPPFTFNAANNPNPNMVAKPGDNRAIAANVKPGEKAKPGNAAEAVAAAKDNKGGMGDPRTVWQEALEQGEANPALVMATAHWLGVNGHWEHAAEFLKANLRQGVVVKPWVYEALTVALRESGASPEEIEKAEVAVADLEPLDSKGFVRAAKGMAASKNYDRAMAFARQASILDPVNAEPLVDTLAYAELANKPELLSWAASRILAKDWADNNEQVHDRAKAQLAGMARRLEPRDPEAAKRLKETLGTAARRDLVVHLAWQGEADLDLRVKEPTGSFCSTLQKQTIGGGVHVGNDILAKGNESYVASEGFAGEYEIRIDTVWGKTLGEKAQLRIIRNQGTPEQFEEVMQIDLRNAKPVKVKLDGGRRSEFAFVAPPEQVKKTINKTELASKIQDRLRNIADPAITGSGAIRTSVGGPGAEMARPEAPRADKGAADSQVMYQTRVNSFMKNAMDVTAQVVASPNGRGMQVRYNTVDNGKPLGAPVVNSSVIPGDN